MPFITNRIRRPDQLPRMAKVLNVDFAQSVLDNKLDVMQRYDVAFRCSICLEKGTCEV